MQHAINEFQEPMRNQILRITLLLVCTGLYACSSSPDPIIDTKGVDMTVYEQDLTECREYADQVDTKTGTAKGAAAGGATGGAVGAISGGSVGKSAGVGAVLGAASSAVKGSNQKSDVVKRCLRGRGYKVLN
jgi:uncharacterized protein YcfJ